MFSHYNTTTERVAILIGPTAHASRGKINVRQKDPAANIVNTGIHR